MGLLDDAIREHLDLKRRRGADPAEVERAEREALGPVRRNREPGEAVDPADAPPAGDFAYDQDQDWVPDALPADETAVPGAELADEHFGSLDSAPPAPAGDLADRRELFDAASADAAHSPAWGEHDDRIDDPFAGDAAQPARLGGGADYDAGDDGAAEDGEDVLEETPEFLQDTPDHDRLWFEQRPPRDFDFDG